MNTILKILTTIILFTICVFWCVVSNSYGKDMTYGRSYLGKTVILNEMEYIITDFSYLESNFTLDNGTKIHYTLIDKFVKEEN